MVIKKDFYRPFISCSLLLTLLAGCGSGIEGNNKETINNEGWIKRLSGNINISYKEPDPLPAPVTKQQNIEVSLPPASSLNNELLKILSFYSKSIVPPKAQRFYKAIPITVTDVDEGQVVVITDSQENPLFFSYLEAITGTVTINSEGIAKGLIWMNPYVLGLEPAQKKEFMTKITKSSLFPQLVNKIDEALVADPMNIFSNDMIIKTSFAVVKELYEIYEIQASVAKNIGKDNDPHITDESGNKVGFENPKAIAYGIEIVNMAGTEYLLVEGKKNFISFGVWPPRFGLTPPEKRVVDLKDGKYYVNFYKGFNWDEEPNWWKPLIPGTPVQVFSDGTIIGTATWVNTFYGIDSVVNACTGLSIREHIVIKILGRFAGKITAEKAAKILSILRNGDPFGAAKEFAEIMSIYFDDIVYAIWQSSPFETKGYVSKITKLLENITPYLEAVSWANSYGPFYWDIVSAKSQYKYCVEQTVGILNECAGFMTIIPPTASIIVSPSYPYVGDTVILNASGSMDDRTTMLQYRFDFDGDGQWDTSWSTSNNATYSYSTEGTYNTKVEVKDKDGLTAIANYYVTVRERGKAISTAIVIDRSGSMYGTPMEDAKNAAKAFIGYMGSADRGALIDFDDVITITQTFTDDKQLLTLAIDGLYARGDTAFYDAVYTAITETTKEDPARRRAIIALTDGNDNRSMYTIQDVVDYAKQADIPIYTIGLGDYVESTTLQYLAAQTDGLYFFAPDSSNLKSIYDTIAGIQASW